MRAYLLIPLLLVGCRISKGANKHDPQFGFADRDVTHPRTFTPRSLSRDGLEMIVEKIWVREAGSIVHHEGDTLLADVVLVNHRGNNLDFGNDVFPLFWVSGPGGRKHATAGITGWGTDNGWLPRLPDPKVPFYLPPGARGLLRLQLSLDGDEAEGPLEFDFAGERAEIR